MKITLLQLNPVVGDLIGNADRIADGVQEARSKAPDLIVTPEMALPGYPPRDILLMGRFIEKSEDLLKGLAKRLAGAPPVLVGLAGRNNAPEGKPLYNAAALLNDGRIEQWFTKTLLPTYDVFDEERYFEPGAGPQTFLCCDHRIGVSICEDIWNDSDFCNRRRYHADPIAELAGAGAEIVVNISASPFTAGKHRLREAMLASIARKYHIPIVYANQVGGNDDLIFDGRCCCAFDREGTLIARGRAFEEDILTVDIDPLHTNRIEPDDLSPESEIWRGLVLGTRDYVRKTGFSGVLLGLSGGIDSALTAAIAAEAVGPNNVLGVLMPSPYSSRESTDDALLLASHVGIRTLTLPIASLMSEFDSALSGAFAGRSRDITEENIQARIRGTLLMALSNKFGALLLTTGNKSEMAVGYCTIYGDMSGGIGVIADVPKTMVYRIARWANVRAGRALIPESIILRAPTAELRAGQRDQDSLPPYEVLDAILHRHIELYQGLEEIMKAGFDRERLRSRSS